MAYHVDRFFAAVSVLAAHGHIKQRLIKAYEDNLEEISEDELPIAVRETFADLKSRMYRVAPLNGEGAICASVRKMSVDEASDCAVSLVELFREIMNASESEVPLEGGERVGASPFLVKSN
jgi:hypothetical protein